MGKACIYLTEEEPNDPEQYNSNNKCPHQSMLPVKLNINNTTHFFLLFLYVIYFLKQDLFYIKIYVMLWHWYTKILLSKCLLLHLNSVPVLWGIHGKHTYYFMSPLWKWSFSRRWKLKTLSQNKVLYKTGVEIYS